MGQEGSSLNDPTSSSSPTITDKHAERRTRQMQGISESPIINNQTTDNDDECKINVHSNMNNYKKTRTNQNHERYYPRKIQSCGDCGYKAIRSNLAKHVQTMHPSSTSALPPTMAMRKKATLIHQCTECEYATSIKRDFGYHRVHHDEKSAHKCPWCSFSVGYSSHLTHHVNYYHTKLIDKCEKQENSVPKKSVEEWYYFDGGKRRVRYKFCGYCDYQTTNRWSLDLHVKMVHPLSTTALQQHLTKKVKEYKFRCAHCSFKTKVKSDFVRHNACHRELPAKYQCHLCSFSVSNRGNLALHLKKIHHLEKMDEKNNNSNADQLSNKNSAASRNGADRRLLLLTCRDCKDFKTTSHFTLKRPIKRAHPFSRLLPLQPLPNRHKKTLHPLKESRLEITEKHHRLVDDVPYPTSGETREKWYISPSGNKKRYIYCTECDYRTVTPSSIINHAEKIHGSVPAHPLIEATQKKIPLLKCLECDFSTSVKGNMNAHKQSHQRNGKFKCHHCSFSSDFRRSIVLHFGHGHHRNLVPLGTPARTQEVPLEARLRKEFGIKNCRVTLHNILSPFFKLINTENMKLLPSNEADQTADVKLEDSKIQLLQIRLKTMEEGARIAEEEVKDITSKNMNVQKRIQEIAARREMIEHNLRTQQCNLLEMGLSALEAEEEPSEMLMKPLEGKAKYLEGAMDVLDIEIGALKEEEKSLAQDVEEAQSSHFGIVQVLNALQFELNGFLLNNSV